MVTREERFNQVEEICEDDPFLLVVDAPSRGWINIYGPQTDPQAGGIYYLKIPTIEIPLSRISGFQYNEIKKFEIDNFISAILKEEKIREIPSNEFYYASYKEGNKRKWFILTKKNEIDEPLSFSPSLYIKGPNNEYLFFEKEASLEEILHREYLKSFDEIVNEIHQRAKDHNKQISMGETTEEITLELVEFYLIPNSRKENDRIRITFVTTPEKADGETPIEIKARKRILIDKENSAIILSCITQDPIIFCFKESTTTRRIMSRIPLGRLELAVPFTFYDNQLRVGYIMKDEFIPLGRVLGRQIIPENKFTSIKRWYTHPLLFRELTHLDRIGPYYEVCFSDRFKFPKLLNKKEFEKIWGEMEGLFWVFIEPKHYYIENWIRQGDPRPVRLYQFQEIS